MRASQVASAVAVCGLLASCQGEVKFMQLPFKGLPICDQTAGLNFLRTPLGIQYDYKGGQGFLTYDGVSVSRQMNALTIPQRKDTLRLRIGSCPPAAQLKPGQGSLEIQCPEPTWLTEPMEFAIDPEQLAANATLTLSVPGAHPCARDVAPPSQ